MAKSDSSVFKRGYNKVARRIVLPNLKAAVSFKVPAGFFPTKVYAENASTTASSVSVGNVAAGAQYLAATAVPVAAGGVPGVLYPTNALVAALPANPGADTDMHVTLTAYPVRNPTAPTAQQKGAVSVVIEFEELYGSVSLPSFVNNAGY